MGRPFALCRYFYVFFSERVIELATDRTGRIEETPGFCKAEDLANLFGLPSQSISQLTRDGVLKKEGTPAGKRYNVVRASRAVIQYLRDKADGREEKGTLESKKLEMLEAEARIIKAKAETAEQEAKWPI